MPPPQWIDINADGFVDYCGIQLDGRFICALGKKSSNGDFFFDEIRTWGEGFLLKDLTMPLRPGDTLEEQHTKMLSNTFRLLDLNADGLVDVCFRDYYHYICGLNTGDGFTHLNSWFTFPEEMQSQSGWTPNNDFSIRLVDQNGDQLPDYCFLYGKDFRCAFNTGNRFENLSNHFELYGDYLVQNENEDGFAKNWLSKVFKVTTDYKYTRLYLAYGPMKVTPDLDQDGFADFCYGSALGLACKFDQKRPQALLQKVISSYGLESDVTYGWATDPSVYTKEQSTQEGVFDVVPTNKLVVSVTTDNGIGGKNHLRWKYQGLKASRDEGSLGFHQITQINESHQKEIVSTYYQGGELTGATKELSTYVGGVRISQVTYQRQTLPGSYPKTYLTRLTSTEEKSWDPNQIPLNFQEQTYSDFDDFNRPLQLVDRVTGKGGLGETHVKVSKTTYWDNTTNWLLGKPVSITVEHQAPNQLPILRKTNFSYDSASGMLLQEILEPETPQRLTHNFSQDLQAQTASIESIDANGARRVVTTNFDPMGRELSVTNQLQQGITSEYDPLCGLPSKQTEPNGQYVLWTYDALCRKSVETRPSGEVIRWKYEWSDGADAGMDYQNLDLILGDRSITMTTIESSFGGWSKHYYDALGREVRTITPGDLGKRVIVDRAYNAKGQLAGVTSPYFEGLFDGDQTHWNLTQYDHLGRTVAQIRPDPLDSTKTITSRVEYSGYQATEIGPLGNRKIKVNNTLGKLEQVQEPDGAIVRYKYDSVGNLIETQAGDYHIRVSYDAMGRRSWMVLIPTLFAPQKAIILDFNEPVFCFPRLFGGKKIE